MKQPIVGIHKETRRITPIGAVEVTGKNCNCVCYECDESLVAVLNTTVTTQYFRHYNLASSCNPSPETQLHLLAKHIILNNSKINIPGRGWVEYTNPVAEWKREDQLVPDAVVDLGDTKMYIEIIVTNQINSVKYEKYKLGNSLVLEIDLREEDREIDYESLQDIVIKELSQKRLLNYAEAEPVGLVSAGGSNWLGWISGIVVLAGAGILVFSSRSNRKRQKF